ncbi:bifunctional diaminohydroxyphosphoribosylaminopyrimidine deaminase/5-amino-6-(5-phosphoribosylamino)uracil reductase RibD [Rhodopirellula sp. P2]|uniref:bifunctional diaminohydroxyphosphoribosylaminopyrimidine deaminase/5-amino-6-(5-phosphoribosylamino)uracil reductase RibD n=1 Tax=Rhodopirellula sp. P2 TaxID=2127060 RepID=UPI0023687F11|nr:bifunctional diaminohydroxyphosphoribosylaminopyrimidine deaminase/5-amino-6-(5-phosphoribosylamino)uracil reductase RibD [Rhodopirellula sp. P2]WDQ19148.1 bifunctional diaminohydroxyphosphoribosylaminopyrimidine deaminase/5-amino-6-(5-phosphoribosylamino)uracil reductase RibD [Rhodopirellula sp. P2]
MANESDATANADSAEDLRWMTEAIALASQGRGQVEPNPPVGCVLVRDSVCIGKGYHQRFGGPHAEVEALSDCADATGATAYVSLEPCCHHGKTPPCADALIRAQVARVVVSVVDPFDQVDGGGIERLRSAGIEVTTGVAKEAGEDLLGAYLKRVRTGMPWVIAKWAMSLDGRIATQTGESKWITGPAARTAVHELRASVDAIAVGMGTVIADNPLLTVRLPQIAKAQIAKAQIAKAQTPGSTNAETAINTRQLVRLVYSQSRLPDLQTQLVQTASETPTWVIAGPEIANADLAKLADHDVDTWQCESSDPIEMIRQSLLWLGSHDNPRGLAMTHLMVEGGSQLLGSFAAARQIDEVHAFIAGKCIGGRNAPGPLGDPGIEALTDATSLRISRMDSFDNDVRLIYRR